jgi:hypothetical protein
MLNQECIQLWSKVECSLDFREKRKFIIQCSSRFSNAQDFITQDCEGGIIVEPVSEIEKLIADS